MNHQKQQNQPGLFSLFARLLVICCVAIGIFAVVGYTAGWITWQYDQESEKSTIEVDTGEVKKAADKAVEKGKSLIEKTGEGIEKLKDAPPETEQSPLIEDKVPEQVSPDAETTVAPDEQSESTQPK